MSLIKLQGNASGTGALTIAAPNTNTDRTLTLPDTTGTIVMNEGSGIFKIDSSGDVGIGTSSPTSVGTSVTTLDIEGSLGGAVRFERTDATASEGYLGAFSGEFRLASIGAIPVTFRTDNTERARIDSSGTLFIGKTTSDSATIGYEFPASGQTFITTEGPNVALVLNRKTTDGQIIQFRQDNVQEGNISINGTAVALNGAHLSRWAQFPDNSRPELLKGTVMSNLDQMSNWDGEDNEQLNCVQVSTVEGDANVAGVFVDWDSTDDDYNDILLGMTGDMVIRIGAGVTVARGDLLMSAGDGTAKPQGDDIVRSKTIAKVTSTHVSHTYADGSYAVPCVLMAC